MEDTEKDRETLKLTISQLEGTKGQQEKALEKLSKEVKTGDVRLQSALSVPYSPRL